MSDESTVYGVFTGEGPLPENLAAGCPATGWMHEAVEPWRVIVSTDAESLPIRTKVAPYTGNEATVDWEIAKGESLIRARMRPTRLFADLRSAVKRLSEDRPVEARQLMDEVWRWHDAWKREQRS